MLFFIRKETVHVAEVWIGLFMGLQKNTRSWCQIGTWKPLDGDTRSALGRSEKEVVVFCSAANVPTLMPVAKIEPDPFRVVMPRIEGLDDYKINYAVLRQSTICLHFQEF